MAIVSFGAIAPAPTTIIGASFTPVNLSGASFSAGNWGGDTPGNLGAIADNNPNSSTTWGSTSGYNNRGWMQVDWGSAISRVYVEVRGGIQMGNGWNNGDAEWFFEIGNDFLMPVWAVIARPGSNEKLIDLSFFGINCRYLRFGSRDSGNGPGMLRWYDLKIWQLNL